MRQGNGSDLLGLKDPRGTKIGIIYVAPNDDRKSVLAAILTQEKLGRKQIAIILPENQPNKAFRRPQDFDDLKAIRRKLHAQLIFIAPAGPGPAEFARQRRFDVYSSLESYTNALRAGLLPEETGHKGKKERLFGNRKKTVPMPEATAGATSIMALSGGKDQPVLVTSPASPIKNGAQPAVPDVSSASMDDDWDALPPTQSAPSLQTNVSAVSFAPDTVPAPTPSSTQNTPDPAVEAEPGIIELPPSSRATSSQSPPAELPATGLAAIVTSTAHSPATPMPSISPQRRNAAKTAVVAGAATTAYGAGASRPPIRDGNLPPPSVSRRKPRWRGLITIVLIIALLLLIGGGVAISAPNLQLFHLSPSTNENTAPATITITPNSKAEQDSYVIQAIIGNADSAKRQIPLRQLTFSPQKHSKSVAATGAGKIEATRASGTLVFSNGSGKKFPLQAGTRIQNSNGIWVTTDQFADIPAGNPLNNFVATISVPAHAADSGAAGNIEALTISQLCCASGDSIGVKNPEAFSGGKSAQAYAFLQQSDVDSVVNQLKSVLSQQALNGLKGQVKSNEQLVSDPQCTAQPNVDQPVGDHGQNIPSANATVSATCTGLAYDASGAQALAQDLLKKKAVSDLGEGYKLAGTVVTKQTVTDVKDGMVTLQVAVRSIWYYQFDNQHKQALAKQLVKKSRTAAQQLLTSYPGIANAKIDITGGSNTLPDDPKQISIKVVAVSGALSTDLPALPTLEPTSASSMSRGRGEIAGVVVKG